MAEFAQAAVPRGVLTSAEAYWWHRRWLKDGADKYDPRVIVRIRAGETVTAATYIDLIKLRERFIRTISAAATGSDAMLMPTTRDTAPTIAEAKSATPVAAKSDDMPATRSAFPDKPSIAVLPFANMSGDAEQEYFADGISEDIITALSKLSQIIARNSSFTFKGKNVHVDEVGKSLGVRYVLEGSVRNSGVRVRVTAQLIDATTGGHLWAERFDRDLIDIFAVQDELTSHIVSALALNLSAGDRQGIAAAQTDNLEAHDCFLRGCGTDYPNGWRQAGVYAGSILKGEKPADLAGATGHQSRVGHQSKERQSAWPHVSANAPEPGRRGD